MFTLLFVKILKVDLLSELSLEPAEIHRIIYLTPFYVNFLQIHDLLF